jgi:hypothetical protein
MGTIFAADQAAWLRSHGFTVSEFGREATIDGVKLRIVKGGDNSAALHITLPGGTVFAFRIGNLSALVRPLPAATNAQDESTQPPARPSRAME